MTKFNNKFFLPIAFSIVFSFCLYLLQDKTAKAVNAFYTDGYERTNMYASAGGNNNLQVVGSDRQTIKKNGYTINKETSTIKGKGKKTVYNTIIIKRKKDEKKTNATKVENTTDNVADPDVLKNSYSKRRTLLKDNDTTSDEKEFWNKVKNPFYAKKPDKFYVYGFASYGFTTPANLRINAVRGEDEITLVNVQAINAKTNWTGSGFGGLLGMKIYFASWYIAPFIGPEFFYTKLNMSERVAQYNSLQKLEDNMYDVSANKYGSNIILPIDMSFKPTDIFGATLRAGLTFWNFLSVFAKASIGGMRSNFILTPRVDLIDWDSMKSNTVSSTDWKNFVDRTTLVLSTEGYVDYRGPETVSHKISLTYAFGIGFEIHTWNQRLTIRMDYDHYFVNSTYNLNSTRYRRWTVDPDSVTTASDFDVIESAKWKVKTNFGMLKLSFGIAI